MVLEAVAGVISLGILIILFIVAKDNDDHYDRMY